MATNYRRPGVYLEESLLLNPSDVAGTTTVAAFVGLAGKGPVNTPYLVESWSQYVTVFGGFDPIVVPVYDPNDITSTAFPLGQNFSNLAALKADPDIGDGEYTGPVFGAGDYVKLNDGSKAHYTAAVWSVGPMTGTAEANTPSPALSYLPFEVFTFFQNGGRFAWIVRATKANSVGEPSSVDVTDGAGTPKTSFSINAISAGEWGDTLAYRLAQTTNPKVFSLEVLSKISDTNYESVEVFHNLSVTGSIAGTKRVDAAINDVSAGSRYIRISPPDLTVDEVEPQPDAVPLDGGVDPGPPDEGDLIAACNSLSGIEGPLIVNITSYLTDASFSSDPSSGSLIGGTFSPTSFPNREDVMTFNDYCKAKDYSSPDSYFSVVNQQLSDDSSSYTAAYTPWILIPHPTQTGAVIPIPPAGAVLGVTARIDATVGYHRAPAGVIAVISNAVGVQAKFTDSEQGDLNAANINVIRPVVGAGICVMGARTRKGYGPDHYISARRTLINIKEQLRRSTQYAVFENNDERLWSSLSITAENILRPLWERGGLRGASPNQAYYIRCDSSLNPISVISAGEVRMEIGVALQYPAEFVVIRITQITSSTFTNEIQVV